MGHNDEAKDLFDLWERCSEGQRWFIFLLCWLEMQKKTRVFWVFVVALVGGPLALAISRDPIAAAIALVVGLAIGMLFILQ